MSDDDNQDDLFYVELTAGIVSAYIANNPVASDGLPALIADVNRSLKALQEPVEPVTEKKAPAVSIKKSLGEERLICLEDGKSFKSLKRHLNTHHGLSPAQYREKWGLPTDYPMVAPAYAVRRSQLAKAAGLGRKAGKDK